MTQHTIKLGETSVSIHSDEFANGIQTGYLEFHTTYHTKPLSDTDIYGVIAQHIYVIQRTSTYNAGFVVGWIKGLLEINPRQHAAQAIIQALAEPLA